MVSSLSSFFNYGHDVVALYDEPKSEVRAMNEIQHMLNVSSGNSLHTL